MLYFYIIKQVFLKYNSIIYAENLLYLKFVNHFENE